MYQIDKKGPNRYEYDIHQNEIVSRMAGTTKKGKITFKLLQKT